MLSVWSMYSCHDNILFCSSSELCWGPSIYTTEGLRGNSFCFISKLCLLIHLLPPFYLLLFLHFSVGEISTVLLSKLAMLCYVFCASSSWNFFVEVLKVLFCLYSSKIQCLYVDVIDCWDSRIISANQSVLSPCCEYYLIIWNKEKFYIGFKAIGDTFFLADIV